MHILTLDNALTPKMQTTFRWDPVKPKGARLREDDSYFDSDALLDGYNQVNSTTPGSSNIEIYALITTWPT